MDAGRHAVVEIVLGDRENPELRRWEGLLLIGLRKESGIQAGDGARSFRSTTPESHRCSCSDQDAFESRALWRGVYGLVGSSTVSKMPDTRFRNPNLCRHHVS